MPVPTSYTENSFALFLHETLGDIADVLGWETVDGIYDEIINDTLLAYGVNNLSQATDIKKLRTLGKLMLFRAGMTAAIPEINYTADGATMSREAIFQHFKTMADQMYLESLAYAVDYNYDAQINGVTRNDPYSYESAIN